MMKKIRKLLFLLGLMTIFYFGDANVAYSRQDETKSIRTKEFTKKRPAAKPTPGKAYATASVQAQTASVKERYYRFVKAKKVKNPTRMPAAKTTERASLGFTLWRWKDAVNEVRDESKGFEVNKRGKKQNLERIETGTPLKIGENARIQIESLSHDGYLYIVNREKFADGTYGEAKLIFPTLDSKNGNFIRAGNLIVIPDYLNEPFEIKSRTDRRQTAEELTIIVSPEPLNDLALEESPITISTDLLMNWVNLWEVDEVQRELDGGAGQLMTIAEQTAGRDQSKGFESKPRLTQEDEPPQTVFDMKIKSGNPILTRVLLEIKPN